MDKNQQDQESELVNDMIRDKMKDTGCSYEEAIYEVFAEATGGHDEDDSVEDPDMVLLAMATGVIALGVGSFFMRRKALLKGWNDFLSPRFGVPQIDKKTMTSIITMFTLLNPQPFQDYRVKDMSKKDQRAFLARSLGYTSAQFLSSWMFYRRELKEMQ